MRIDSGALRTRARIAAWSIWDELTNPEATEPDDVPSHGEAASRLWLTAVLGRGVDGAEATAVRVVGGDDGSSVRRRLRLTWNAAGDAGGLPTNLFTKTTPTFPTRLSAGIAAPTEGRFLLTLKPSVSIQAPLCYFSDRDARTGRSIHVMEDLGVTQHATFLHALAPVDLGQAERMIVTLATLHGTFLSDRHGPDYTWLARYEDFHRAATRSGIRAGHDAAVDRAANVVPTAVASRWSRIWPAAEQALALHDTHDRTVIHSDVHPGNWYQNDTGDMGLCDWARVCRGHWARDLAYMLMSTLTVQHRRDWERDLIRLYLDVLARRCERTVAFDDAWLAYRQQAIAALLMWTPTLCPPPLLPDMQPETVSLTMIERITHAMQDLDVLALF